MNHSTLQKGMLHTAAEGGGGSATRGYNGGAGVLGGDLGVGGERGGGVEFFLTPYLFCNACNCYRIVYVQQPWNTSLTDLTTWRPVCASAARLSITDQCPSR